jgi:hypothetical protein
MADFVLNEWLWSDLSGETDTRKQEESYRILVALTQGSDRLVVVEGSAFAQKCWRLSKVASDVLQRDAVKLFKSLLVDPAKCLRLGPTTLKDPPPGLAARCKADDYYLIQAQQAVPDSTVITTDNDLMEALQASGLPCRRRDQWVPAYLATAGIYVN